MSDILCDPFATEGCTSSSQLSSVHAAKRDGSDDVFFSRSCLLSVIGAGDTSAFLELTSLGHKQLRECLLLFERLLGDEVPRWYEARLFLHRLVTSCGRGGLLSCVNAEKKDKQNGKEVEVEGYFTKHLLRMESADKCKGNWLSIVPFAEFLQKYKHISVFPTLRVLPLEVRLRQVVQEWLASHNGLCAVIFNLSVVMEFDALLHAVDQAFASAVLTSAQSASEALLLASLTDVCRYCIQLMSTFILSEGNFCLATTMQDVVEHNSRIVSQVDDELRNYGLVMRLLAVAQSTAYYRCSEDVQANVSPLIAELLSLFDELSLSPPALPLDRRKMDTPQCKLSGIWLNYPYPPEMVDEFVLRYWKKTMAAPIPF